MLSYLSIAATFIGWLVGIPAMVVKWEARRQGRADQKAADTSEALKIVARERDAVARAGSAEEAAKYGQF